MSERFLVEAQSPMFRYLDNVQVVFHDVEKSYSCTIYKSIEEGLSHVNRELDYICHYGKNYSEKEFHAIVKKKQDDHLS